MKLFVKAVLALLKLFAEAVLLLYLLVSWLYWLAYCLGSETIVRYAKGAWFTLMIGGPMLTSLLVVLGIARFRFPGNASSRNPNPLGKDFGRITSRWPWD